MFQHNKGGVAKMKRHALVACLIAASFFNAAKGMAAAHHRHAPASTVRHMAGSHHAKPSRPSISFGRYSVAVKPVVIAIDAGHGGKDTGAIGYNGTYEKDVAYAIAHRLEHLIRAEPGMRAVMIRQGDVFIPLRQRAEIARRAGADLFISVHADAYQDAAAKGSAVFTLLPRQVDVEGFADDTLEASRRVAGKVLGEMRKKQTLHCRRVKKARFAVLKSSDVPSMLVETGFISNPDDERKLSSPSYQEKVARSIFDGISAYFRAFRPARPMAVKGGVEVMASGP